MGWIVEWIDHPPEGAGAYSRLLHEEISALWCQTKRPRPRALENADEKLEWTKPGYHLTRKENYSNCVPDYNRCFQLCGGRLEERSVCIADKNSGEERRALCPLLEMGVAKVEGSQGLKKPQRRGLGSEVVNLENVFRLGNP